MFGLEKRRNSAPIYFEQIEKIADEVGSQKYLVKTPRRMANILAGFVNYYTASMSDLMGDEVKTLLTVNLPEAMSIRNLLITAVNSGNKKAPAKFKMSWNQMRTLKQICDPELINLMLKNFETRARVIRARERLEKDFIYAVENGKPMEGFFSRATKYLKNAGKRL